MKKLKMVVTSNGKDNLELEYTANGFSWLEIEGIFVVVATRIRHQIAEEIAVKTGDGEQK